VRTIACATTFAAAAVVAACSSSSGGGSGAPDAQVIDVLAVGEAQSEVDATSDDASEQDAGSSPVFGCNEAQLAYATTMACGQCVAQKCAKYLKACTNCIDCQQQIAMGCSACVSMCFGVGGPGPGPGTGPGMPFDSGAPIGGE
jgi:hypothetical protein